jgi:hypothetical protein
MNPCGHGIDEHPVALEYIYPNGGGSHGTHELFTIFVFPAHDKHEYG